MSMVIGPWTLEGSDPQNTILQPMAEKAAVILALEDGGSRVKPARVIVKPRNEMPWADDAQTIRARGYWDGRNITLADDLFPTPDLARKTFAHEIAHQLDDQWMLRSNERDIKPLFDPPAVGWPSEPFAVYGSAAIFGFTNPPYQNFYKGRKIPVVDWPKVKEIALRDDHVDPCQEWKDAVAVLTQQLNDERAAHDETRAQLATANARITAKDEALSVIEAAAAKGLAA